MIEIKIKYFKHLISGLIFNTIMANKRKKFLPDNVIELMFGVGASIVIIGALLKITHADLIPGYVTGNDMLTMRSYYWSYNFCNFWIPGLYV